MWCVTACTWNIGSADVALLQDVSISTAAVVCPRAIFTQLVTDPPNLTVIIVWTTEQAVFLEKNLWNLWLQCCGILKAKAKQDHIYNNKSLG